MTKKTFYENEKAIETKHRLCTQQNWKCFVCGKAFTSDNLPEMAHRIPKHKWILKKYGPEVIHHIFNLRATCHGDCNDSVMIDPETRTGQDLICEIMESIENER